jgi:DNA polymerase III sliding clamp (beta) subunit (PCNA family)
MRRRQFVSGFAMATLAIIGKLIRKARPEGVSLHQSDALVEIACPAWCFRSRLVAATYPDYRAILPTSANGAAVDRIEFAAALDRLSAAADYNKDLTPLVALRWGDGELFVELARQPDAGADSMTALTQGGARIALSLPALSALVAEFDSKDLHLEITERTALVIRTEGKLGLLVSCKWNFEDPSHATGAGVEEQQRAA